MQTDFIKYRLPKLSFSNIFLFILVTINILPVLAPIFQHLGWTFPAKAIYFIYSFMCHQIHWRSLHIYDHQCAWCARDMAIWGAVLFTAVVVKIFKLRGLKWFQVLPFVMPIALDGGVQTLATFIGIGGGNTLYVSTNLMRTITGAIFGVGLGSVFMPALLELESYKLKSVVGKVPQLAIISSVVGLVFVGYLMFVQLWSMTSTNYRSDNFLDSTVKIPEYGSEFIERRRNGACPVTVSAQNADLNQTLALDCFFK